jgi:hypothetical protein
MRPSSRPLICLVLASFVLPVASSAQQAATLEPPLASPLAASDPAAVTLVQKSLAALDGQRLHLAYPDIG